MAPAPHPDTCMYQHVYCACLYASLPWGRYVHDGPMNLDLNQAPRLDDEELSRQAPLIRAQVGIRYEQLWKAALPGILNMNEDPDWRVDPRLVEAGIRILRNMATLYRLDQPAQTEREEPTATRAGTAALVLGHLDQLAARMSGQEE